MLKRTALLFAVALVSSPLSYENIIHAPNGEIVAETEATAIHPMITAGGLNIPTNPFAPGRRESRKAQDLFGPPWIPTPAEPPYRIIRAEVTAYVPGDGVTANGTEVGRGSKAISAPKSIPFGTKMEIEGYGVAEVVDRGGAIKIKPDGTYILDILLPTVSEANKWGRRTMEVKVYD